MPRLHIPDYGSRLSPDSATTRKMKKSDYCRDWSGMSYHCRDAVVNVRNRVGKVGKSLPTVMCVPYHSGDSADFVESDYNRNYVVTDSAVSD
jgi:hypothetical protein